MFSPPSRIWQILHLPYMEDDCAPYTDKDRESKYVFYHQSPLNPILIIFSLFSMTKTAPAKVVFSIYVSNNIELNKINYFKVTSSERKKPWKLISRSNVHRNKGANVRCEVYTIYCVSFFDIMQIFNNRESLYFLESNY